MLILLWGIISEKWKYSISSHVLLLRFFFYFLWVCLCRRCMYMGCVCMWTEEDGHQTVLMWCSPPYNFEAESLTEPGAHSFRLIWKLQAACSSPPACSRHYWSCRLARDHAGLVTCVLGLKLWDCCLCSGCSRLPGYLCHHHCGYLRWHSKY